MANSSHHATGGGGGSPLRSTSMSSTTKKSSSRAVELAQRRARQLARRKMGATVLTIMVATIFGVWGFYAFQYGATYLMRRDEVVRQAVRDQEFGPLLDHYQQRLDTLDQDYKYLQERLRTAEQERSSLIQVSTASRHLVEQHAVAQQAWHEMELSKNIKQLEEQVHLHQHYQQQYAQGIQDVSRFALVDKFGPGPHHVKLHLAFPGGGGSNDPTSTLLLEMAPASDMPHTVYTFLQRVAHGLYDGTSFYHNADHVLVAGAMPNVHTPAHVDLMQRFDASGLRHTVFQEYSPNWPHEPFTIGLAGRPAGTEFYINTKDNSEFHGPGGQTKYPDASLADPCFAKIVRGFDVITRMQSIMSGSVPLEGRISILKAEIV